MTYEYSPEEQQKLIKTSRASGIIGSRPTTVTRWTEKLAYRGLRILDYGSGHQQKQTQYLLSLGLDVTPYDFHTNPGALHGHYEIVMLSNVINIQPHRKALIHVLEEASSVVTDCGFMLLNYPKSPRKMDWNTEKLYRQLKIHFHKVRKLPDKTDLFLVYP
jgi:hypothetical protein